LQTFVSQQHILTNSAGKYVRTLKDGNVTIEFIEISALLTAFTYSTTTSYQQ